MARGNQARSTQRFIRISALLVSAFTALAQAQEPNLPVLTLDEAIAQAIANNSDLKTADLETYRATDDLAANKTRRFANTQIIALGASY